MDKPTGPGSDDRAGADRAETDWSAVAPTLETWFAGNARDLPWRRPGTATRRDPYRTLVSELMLQQTQVARVVPKFLAFVERFPAAAALAAAPLDDALAMWSGLGYYRRARLLHAAAVAIAERHGGEVPKDEKALLDLPGVGRYTAGAVGSLAFDLPRPLVDGNVTRVVLRLAGRPLTPQDAEAAELSWTAAEAIASAAESPGDANEAIMELGATVCTPIGPACGRCPLVGRCRARAAGLTDSIPLPKPRATKKMLYCTTARVTDDTGRVLIRQRPTEPPAGERSLLWAGMFEAPTIESAQSPPDAGELAAALGVPSVTPAETFAHQTTHRDVRFAVYDGSLGVGDPLPDGCRWLDPADIAAVAVSNPQKRIITGLDASATLFDGNNAIATP